MMKKPLSGLLLLRVGPAATAWDAATTACRLNIAKHKN
jgi:hypothetical protein